MSNDEIQKPSITMRRNGPLLVQGDVVLLDADGNVYEPPKRPFALCRCGGSAKRPFCDGTHSRNGYCDTAAEILDEEK
jgi:CDGSH-type Zn-finger protein